MLKMVDALDDTRTKWLDDKKSLQSEIDRLEKDVAQSTSELKENIDLRVTDAEELEQIKLQLKNALEENNRLKNENDLLKIEHASSPLLNVSDEKEIPPPGEEDESFHSPLTTPIPMQYRTSVKKRRSSAAFVRRSSSLPARNEMAARESDDDVEDDDCYYTSIKRIKCSQNLQRVDLNFAISDRCLSAMSSGTPGSDASYDNRLHSFTKRRNFYRISCAVCNMSIGFSSMFIKCPRCKGMFHEHCRYKVSMPCITWITPPKAADASGMRLRLGDFCPNERPMIPPLIAYCVYYLNKGPSPTDLYENYGSELEVEAIGKLFKTSVNLVKLDGYSKVSIAATIKKFLSEIREPLIPSSYAKEFVQAASAGSLDIFPKLLNDLPTAHMDALACLCRHWRLYVEAAYCNLSVTAFCARIACTVFGVRENCTQPASNQMVVNARTAFMVVKNLLEFPVDFWTDMLNHVNSNESSRAHTPLMRNPSGRSTVSMKTTSSSNSRYPNINFEKADA